VHPGHKILMHFFHTWVGPLRFLQKARRDTLRQTCVFAYGGIYVSYSALQCARATKCQCTIFHARVRLVWISQKSVGTHYAELVFLHLVGSAADFVHSDAFGA
jgi:hypothetical protein